MNIYLTEHAPKERITTLAVKASIDVSGIKGLKPQPLILPSMLLTTDRRIMGELTEIFKTVGIVSSSFIIVAGIAITLLRYVLKSNEQKNNIIANHIQHTNEAIVKQAEATNRNTEVLQDVNEVINQNTIVLISMKDTIQEVLRELRRD